MYPKDFIKKVLIGEVGKMKDEYPYISFLPIATGIEFLGKCLNGKNDWNYFKKGQPKRDFENAIKKLKAFKKYRTFLIKYSLWDSLRNGFSHSFRPKPSLSLSSGKQIAHLRKYTSNSIDILNLKVEDFFEDFKKACEEVVEMNFEESDKMNRQFIGVPK